jgi:hypothetical protein
MFFKCHNFINTLTLCATLFFRMLRFTSGRTKRKAQNLLLWVSVGQSLESIAVCSKRFRWKVSFPVFRFSNSRQVYLGAVFIFCKQLWIQLAFWFFQIVSISNCFAVWLTIFKIASGESAFLFMQTASTSCQSATCFIVSKTVYIRRRAALFKNHLKIMRTLDVSTGCYGWQHSYFWTQR